MTPSWLWLRSKVAGAHVKRNEISRFAAEWWGHPFLRAFAFMLIAVTLSIFFLMEAAQRRIIENEAVKIAEIVARNALAARTVYTEEITDKLGITRTGIPEVDEREGRVAPVPAEFLKRIGHESSRTSDGVYKYRPLSKWNLDPAQGLQDEFQRWAWGELEKQDQVNPTAPIDWRPAWRIEQLDGERTLRYVRADPAANSTCIECHARHEARPQTKNSRVTAGVTPGREWKLHQLLGAIEVLVPMGRVEALAAGQTRQTVVFVLVVSALGLSIVAIAALRDVRRKQQLAAQFERQAMFDSLTGIANRANLVAHAEDALLAASRDKSEVAVIFIDLDNFKQINDSLGHAAGDDVLRETASRLQETLRRSDLPGRYSGDEFAVLIRDFSCHEDLAAVARKLLLVLSQPIEAAGRKLVVTVSMGIACYPRDGNNAVDLLRNADAAMYRAKQDGRDNYRFFSERMNPRALERLETTTELRRALDMAQFELHYQPKIDLADRTVAGLEALIRWRHPEHGLIGPHQFIPIAEETGLIVPIGDWVLRTALLQARQWRDLGIFHHRVAVNLSLRQFVQRDLAQHVEDMLRETGMSGSQLELEITESMMEADSELVVRTIKRLRDQGVAIAIDDFGVGYSGLRRIKRFAIDTIKIDKSFIEGLPFDEQDAAITGAILTVARALDIRVVAEGVETLQQLKYLYHAGCDQGQGYFLSHPLCAAEVPAFLRAHARRRSLPRYSTVAEVNQFRA